MAHRPTRRSWDVAPDAAEAGTEIRPEGTEQMSTSDRAPAAEITAFEYGTCTPIVSLYPAMNALAYSRTRSLTSSSASMLARYHILYSRRVACWHTPSYWSTRIGPRLELRRAAVMAINLRIFAGSVWRHQASPGLYGAATPPARVGLSVQHTDPPFGAASGSRLGDRLADHIGGSARAYLTPSTSSALLLSLAFTAGWRAWHA